MNKLKDLKFTGTELLMCVVFCYIIMIMPHIAFYRTLKNKNDQIQQLEQNNIEQAEENEVYRNRCKMYEDFMKENGLLDECECR